MNYHWIATAGHYLLGDAYSVATEHTRRAGKVIGSKPGYVLVRSAQ